MLVINNRLVIYIYNSDNNTIEEYNFTKVDDNLHYDGFFPISLSMTQIDFININYNPYKLNFSCKIENDFNPSCYLEWLFTNKNKYEINKGQIYKLSVKKNDTSNKNLFIGKLYKFDEITNFIESFENIYVGFFDIDYTKKYLQKNVEFVKIKNV